MDAYTPKYSAADLAEAKSVQVAYALKLMADHPGDSAVRAQAREIMLSDPADLLDFAEQRANPIDF